MDKQKWFALADNTAKEAVRHVGVIRATRGFYPLSLASAKAEEIDKIIVFLFASEEALGLGYRNLSLQARKKSLLNASASMKDAVRMKHKELTVESKLRKATKRESSLVKRIANSISDLMLEKIELENSIRQTVEISQPTQADILAVQQKLSEANSQVPGLSSLLSDGSGAAGEAEDDFFALFSPSSGSSEDATTMLDALIPAESGSEPDAAARSEATTQDTVAPSITATVEVNNWVIISPWECVENVDNNDDFSSPFEEGAEEEIEV